MESIDQSVKNFFDNPIVLGVIAIFITMYGPRLSPKLPDFVKDAFNNSVFRFIIMVLVIFSGLKDIRLALIISILFIGIMSIVNTQNIKEDYHNQVQEYYANYNLFKGNTSEHFEDFHENYANTTTPISNSPQVVLNNQDTQKVTEVGTKSNVLNGNSTNLNSVQNSTQMRQPANNTVQNESQEDEEESIDINHDAIVGEHGETIEPNNNMGNVRMNRNTNKRVEKYIDTAMGVLSDMDKFSKTPGSGVSDKCQNLIKLPNKQCIKEIKSKIAAENLSETIKNKITKQFEETKWFSD